MELTFEYILNVTITHASDGVCKSTVDCNIYNKCLSVIKKADSVMGVCRFSQIFVV